jgi:hypothetical protein
MTVKILFCFLGTLALANCTSIASAAIVSTGPFIGTYSESFESFPDYLQDGSDNPYFPEQSSIMGGFATISSAHNDMLIYNPGAGAFWGLGGATLAGVADGSQGLGLESAPGSATITFDNPVTAFGGYFAADEVLYSPIVTFDFSDGSSDSFAYSDPNGNGTLVWAGWDFSTDVSSVTISGNYLVMDGLQVEVAPEPTTLALTGLCGLLAFALARRRLPFCVR